MAYLAPWLGWWGAGIGSAVLFGIGHAYQGPAGVLKTTVVGLVLAGAYGFSRSLWPAIILHSAIDLQAGAIGYELFGRGGCREPAGGSYGDLSVSRS